VAGAAVKALATATAEVDSCGRAMGVCVTPRISMSLSLSLSSSSILLEASDGGAYAGGCTGLSVDA